MEVINFDCNGNLIADLGSIKLSEELTESIFRVFFDAFNQIRNEEKGEQNDTSFEGQIY